MHTVTLSAHLKQAPKLDASLLPTDRFISAYDLSEREVDVVRLLTQGCRYKDIGDKLFISIATVKKHILHIYQKTGARHKVELINLLRKSAS